MKPQKTKSNPVVNFIEIMVLMLALWFVMSGIFELKFIIYGVCTCLLISLMCMKHLTVNSLKSGDIYFILDVNYFKLFFYTLWLLKEVCKAALYVSKVVLFRRDLLNPQIVWFKADYDNPVARVLLANSITLTPGTITIDITGQGVYSVHALTDELAQGLLDGSMQAKVAKVYGEVIDFERVTYVPDTTGLSEETAHLKVNRYRTRKKVDRL